MSGSVLIVDDNQGVTKALSMLIRNAGFEPIACHCGREALDGCAAGAKPVAAIVDIHLPDINGLVLAQKLREQLGQTAPIIVVSGDTSMETIKSLSHVGATYFFPKPVQPAALVEQLNALIGTQPNRAAG